MQKKDQSDAGNVLKQLGKLSGYLSELDAGSDRDHRFDVPLDIIRKTMLFDVAVLYRISNVIENRLILDVVRVMDPDNFRTDLHEGRQIRLFLDGRDPRYVNEVRAFKTQKVSWQNVPGMGSDIMGYVYLPESFGGAYLFGGDFCGNESSVTDYEIAGVEVMCNFLSAILLKTQFKQQAEFDHLTGLFNSGKIRQETEKMIKRLERKTSSSACIALGDIDYFKKINDTCGHIQGDRVLSRIGQILSSSMRAVFDLAGRYGGEEFLLIFDETDEDQAFAIVERLRASIEKTAFERVDKEGKPLDGKSLHLTMSFGVAGTSPGQRVPDALDWISRADQALYRSKAQGRNRTTLYRKE